eukprot:1828433-Prymnesium_polylepis.1
MESLLRGVFVGKMLPLLSAALVACSALRPPARTAVMGRRTAVSLAGASTFAAAAAPAFAAELEASAFAEGDVRPEAGRDLCGGQRLEHFCSRNVAPAHS